MKQEDFDMIDWKLCGIVKEYGVIDMDLVLTKVTRKTRKALLRARENGTLREEHRSDGDRDL